MEKHPLQEVADKTVAVAQFIGSRLLGGAWAELPKPEYERKSRPIKQNMLASNRYVT